ncbi:FtsX-like permease family protein [Actinotignum sp. GS-2025b]|uniref:FtsX-like permease family protein n=1 Tax=Actinotignum sp. GS-2025b TaxID=3427275 RepID=UPI003F4607F0
MSGVTPMSAGARAGLALRRRPVRNVLLFVVISVIFTALVAQAGVRGAMGQLRTAIDAQVGAGFVASAPAAAPSGADGAIPSDSPNTNPADNPLTQAAPTLSPAQASQLAALPGVTSTATEQDILATPVGARAVATAGGVQLDAGVMGAVTVTASSDPARFPAFAARLYRLTSGKMNSSAKPGALIHRDFAEANTLRLGDELRLRGPAGEVTRQITGIFDGTTPNPSGLPASAAANRILVDSAAGRELSGEAGATRVRCFTASASELPASLAAARAALPDLSYEHNAASFTGVLRAMDSVEGLLSALLSGACAAGVVIAAAVLALWVRGRMREIGVLLSLGQQRRVIAGGFALELGALALAGGVVAILAGRQLTALVGRAVVDGAAPGALAGLPPVAVSGADIAWALGVGAGILAVALAIALFPILRRSPRQILSSLS